MTDPENMTRLMLIAEVKRLRSDLDFANKLLVRHTVCINEQIENDRWGVAKAELGESQEARQARIAAVQSVIDTMVPTLRLKSHGTAIRAALEAELMPIPDTVTIEVSRKAAEVIATQWGHDENDGFEFVEVEQAVRKALEADRD